MIWALGFLVTFLFGGLTGVILASPAMDFHVSDTYFIVAHFHYTSSAPWSSRCSPGYYFWWPKLTGRMLDEPSARSTSGCCSSASTLTFLVQHLLGIQGMAAPLRRLPARGRLQTGNVISTVGAFLLGASMLPFLYNVWKTWRTAPLVRRRRPVGLRRLAGVGHLCPPPRHNFDSLPRIRSERPAFDLHHPEAALARPRGRARLHGYRCRLVDRGHRRVHGRLRPGRLDVRVLQGSERALSRS
jgi:cytochrome c oxidase subunit 1